MMRRSTVFAASLVRGSHGIFELPRGIIHCHERDSLITVKLIPLCAGSRDKGEIGQDVGEAPACRDLYRFQGYFGICLSVWT